MPRTSLLLFAAVIALSLGLDSPADARLGGGRSFGAQRQGVAPTRPAPAPAAPGSAATQPAAPTAAGAPKAPPPVAPAPSGASRWLGPIAGLAAGLGLAALMSHFGLSEGFGSVLLIALLVMGAIFVLRAFLGRRQAPGALQYAGPGDDTRSDDRRASAPEWTAPQTANPSVAAEATAPKFGVTSKPLPQGFDAEGFAKEAKRQYIQIQRSYDEGDRAALASVMTSEMNTEIGRELDERVVHQPTEIVTLDASVLDVSEEDDKYWVSVRFTGLMREQGEPLPKSVDEIWNLTKPVKGSSGWLLAGISQLA
jgi:predicted lipid-binding transport protein (Tim44 family)